ncbi:hypothetical protein, partial [Streptomyces dysideae]|uniref:hypothetical protein n=1 Tax=Streptomyces dysideae TaxID=909626 RepID=UPI000A88997A
LLSPHRLQQRGRRRPDRHDAEGLRLRLSQQQKDDAAKKAGIPPEPTGADRQALLDAIAKAAPDAVKYEDKAIDAARNQCSAINGEASRLDWLASQRFTDKVVVTTEAQGKAVNEALQTSGFCGV